MLVGIAFKFGAAPFHMWLPDVYQGAPTAITLFIGSVPKLAYFGMAYRLLEAGVGPLDAEWRDDAVAGWRPPSLVVGNVFALAQTNLKRLLAYSTISHVGFLFMGLANASQLGYAAAMFYAMTYAIMGAAAFAAIILLSRRGFDAEKHRRLPRPVEDAIRCTRCSCCSSWPRWPACRRSSASGPSWW